MYHVLIIALSFQCRHTADVRKELNFCQKTKVPVLGVVENMGSLQTTLSKLTFLDESGDDKTEFVIKELQEKCPHLLNMVATTDLFRIKNNDKTTNGGGLKGAELMAQQYSVPYWGSLPLDADLLKCCEEGKSVVDVFPESIVSKTLTSFSERLTKALPVDMES
jgi:NUBPL iron-transfer P-loop NTPase